MLWRIPALLGAVLVHAAADTAAFTPLSSLDILPDICDAPEELPRCKKVSQDSCQDAFDASTMSLCVDALSLVESLDPLFGGRYRLGESIGSGTYGEVYTAVDVLCGEEVAIKTERVDALETTLEKEFAVYKAVSGGEGVPDIKWFGIDGDYRALVLDLLGPSLSQYFHQSERKMFSLKTVILLADQMITRIEHVHSRGLVHHDIKPGNFVMGLGQHASQVYIIDFGSSTPFRDPETLAHIPYSEDTREEALTRNFRYGSINSHLGVMRTRRDDLEGLAYVWVYWLRGTLPWFGLRAQKISMRRGRILAKMRSFPVKRLTHSLPDEFAEYIEYTRALGFDEQPDYAYLRRLFRDVAAREGFEYDGVFDWTAKS
ncbi:Kinase-like protein [Mycena chlorophos]|uniref:non-specific serine/threonine protein kinase n=1 Tax=Mycena chlorophos TaxID=658473 RepID=A0A8H6W4D3_MYCCL|nr:Kinase-like protein [Mycena chlorophos]